jgi:hypothetical protein
MIKRVFSAQITASGTKIIARITSVIRVKAWIGFIIIPYKGRYFTPC